MKNVIMCNNKSELGKLREENKCEVLLCRAGQNENRSLNHGAC